MCICGVCVFSALVREIRQPSIYKRLPLKCCWDDDELSTSLFDFVVDRQTNTHTHTLYIWVYWANMCDAFISGWDDECGGAEPRCVS